MSEPVYLPATNVHPQRRETRDQENTLMCVYYATAGAMTTAAWRAGFDHVYSPSYIGQMAKAYSGRPGDTGGEFDQLAESINRNGMALDSEFNGYHNWSLTPTAAAISAARARRPISLRRVVYRGEDPIKTIKYYHGRGQSVILVMMLPLNYRASVQYVPWRKQVIQAQTNVFEHAMECIGTDDEAGRVLCINSGGGTFGDAGYAGLEYKHLRHGAERIVFNLFVIDQSVYPLVPLEGFMPGTAELNYTEMAPARAAIEAQRNAWNAKLAPHIPASFTSWQWLLDACAAENITDRQLEFARRWDRGTVQAFVRDPAYGLVQGSMIFEPV